MFTLKPFKMLIPSSSLLFPLCFFVAGIHAAPIGMPTNLQVRAEMVQLIEQRSLPSLLPIELERRDLDMDLERRDFEAANFERCDNFHLARLERRFKLKSKKSGGDGKVIFDALGKIFGRLVSSLQGIISSSPFLIILFTESESNSEESCRRWRG